MRGGRRASSCPFLLSDGHTCKVLLDVMMCKMRKMSPLAEWGEVGDGEQRFQLLMCLILRALEWRVVRRPLG